MKKKVYRLQGPTKSFYGATDCADVAWMSTKEVKRNQNVQLVRPFIKDINCDLIQDLLTFISFVDVCLVVCYYCYCLFFFVLSADTFCGQHNHKFDRIFFSLLFFLFSCSFYDDHCRHRSCCCWPFHCAAAVSG